MSSAVSAVPNPYPVSRRSVLSATTTTSSIVSKIKFSLVVSPTTKFTLETSSLLKSADETETVYGPPGFNPPNENLPFAPVTLTDSELVGS